MFDVTLSNGKKMNVLGYGTYKITGDFDATACVLDAIETGYRRIDTATFYHNEGQIGEAVKSSGLPRKELFIATKLWTDNDGYDKALRTVDNSLKLLKTDYLDLLLIHWPTPANGEVWRAMERLYREGAVGAIGVSNFKEHHIDDLIRDFEITPMVNQVEFHPLFQQPELRAYCKEHDIQLEAWSPLMRGKIFEMDELARIAARVGKTVAQVVLRYDIQLGVAVIPKTTNKARMAENLDVFDFELTADDMRLLSGLNRNERQYRDPDNHGY